VSREQVIQTLAEHRLLAILRGDFKDRVSQIAGALLDGGIQILEVSAISPDYAGVIRNIVTEFGSRIMVGAGTILTLDQIKVVADAGASFVVSPNTDRKIIETTKKLCMASFPGAYTPTEILFARECGADAVKLFPAVSLGPQFVKALRGPLPGIRLISTGGIHAGNLSEYLEAGSWAVAIGSELVRSNEAELGDWESLQARAAELAILAKGGRDDR
jgi:Entner-Doudoroff aldolase